VNDGNYEDAVHKEEAREDNLKIGKHIAARIIREEVNTSALGLPEKSMRILKAAQHMQRSMIVSRLVPNDQHLEELADATILFIAQTAGDEAADQYIQALLKG
jgi:hypothetical protein